MIRDRKEALPLALRTAGSGPPILLLHAFPLHAGMWSPQIEALACTHRVIAADAPGFGASPPWGEGWTLREFARRLARELEALGVAQAVVCGLSMGGYVALTLAREAPLFVRALVLADTRAGADSAEGVRARELFAEEAQARGIDWVADSMLPKLLGASAQPSVVAAVRALIREGAPSAVAAAQRAMARRGDSVDLLPSIAGPTLILVGEEDSLTPPREAETLAAGIPASRLVVLPRAGHLSNLQAPDDFNKALATWLAEKRL